MSHGNGRVVLLAGSSNPELAGDIARLSKAGRLTKADVRTFADGEISVSIYESVRGADVFIIQSTCKPVNDNLMELLVMIDACKRASASRVTAVVPYFGYARQDRKAKARDPISAKLVANLITAAGADRVLTMDLHASQIQGFFDIPVDNMTAARMLADHYIKAVGKGNPKYVVVSPDVGSVARARNFAQHLGVKLAIVDKRRDTDTHNQTEVMNIIGDVQGKNVILFDDMIDTAGSLCNAAKALKETGGAEDIYACASHGVLSPPALERIKESCIKKLRLVDTIPYPEAPKSEKIYYITCAGLFAEAITRVHENIAISGLFT